MTGFGNVDRSQLVQGAFDRWVAQRPHSSEQWHAWFEAFRYGFQDGEMMITQANKTPAYLAGWTAGRNYQGPR